MSCFGLTPSRRGPLGRADCAVLPVLVTDEGIEAEGDARR